MSTIVSDQPAPGVRGGPFRVDLRLVVMAVGLMLLVIALAIGVRQVLTGTPQPAASSGDTSPYAQLFAQVGPNGEVTKETALEAFSLAIAPLPGVTVPTGAPPTDAEREDGTFAVDWLRPYMNELTPDQAAAVKAALAPDPQAPVSTPEPSVGAGLQIRLASFTQGDVMGYADDARKAIGANLHRSLAIPWTVTVNHVNVHVNGEDAWAYTTQVDGGSGCAIHVNPLLADGSDTVLAKVVMAHEMFHCFQGDWLRMLGHVDAAIPAWIIEGQANWAAENVAGPTPYGSNGWGDYLTHPDYSLWQESYNAIGFYQHAEEEQIDPWAHFDAMLTAYTSASLPSSANPDAFKAAGAAADSFLDTWASGYFRDQKRGGPWYATGPWAVDGKAEVDAVAIHPGDTKTASAQPATNMVWTTIAASDIIEVRGQNHVRMYIDSAPELPVVERWLCFKDGGCTCPAGERYSGPELEDVSAGNNGGYQQIDFGITGSLDGAQVTVRGHSLDEFCKPLPSLQPTDGQRYPGSNGDPHLRTVNRYKYDFQAAGEFTLIRNADSSIEIQARQEPHHALRPSAFNAVSINTAVAVRDDGHRIGVYMTPAGPALRVDGARVDPASLPDLGGGASIEPVTAGFKIGFPDGTVLAVLSVSPWGVNAVVQPSETLRSSAAGLLGPITPGGMGVPALPDGSQLPAAPDRPTRDTVLYGQFADAWRVSDSTTLFDYDPGTSTATYTDRAFPSDVARAALEAANASPDPDQLAAAQSACAAVTDPDLLSDCEFDVYATGDDGFAQQYAATQDLFDSGIDHSPGSPAPSPAGPVTGAQKVVELQDLDGATIGQDDTVYVSITDSSGSPQLLAIDPVTAAVKQHAGMRAATDLHFAAGSVWAAGQTTDANGQHCTVTRYDPQSLADQGDLPIPCANGYPGPHLTSMGDAVWFVDTTRTDPSTGAGAALTRIDPASNTPGKSVPLGYAGGCCQDSNGAVFCFCGQSDMWRLTAGDSSFVDLGRYAKIFPAGDGFWTQEGDSAEFVNAPGGPSVTVQETADSVGESVVGGDPTAVYLQGKPPDEALIRQPADGSAPTTLAKAPISGSGVDQTQYDYGAGGSPWIATPAGYLNLWVFKATPDSPNALWLQWAPIH